jgi:hypothetical protein
VVKAQTFRCYRICLLTLLLKITSLPVLPFSRNCRSNLEKRLCVTCVLHDKPLKTNICTTMTMTLSSLCKDFYFCWRNISWFHLCEMLKIDINSTETLYVVLFFFSYVPFFSILSILLKSAERIDTVVAYVGLSSMNYRRRIKRT